MQTIQTLENMNRKRIWKFY